MNSSTRSESERLLSYSSYCRVCLQSGTRNTELFTDTDESNNILNIINSCFRISLSNDHQLPSSICSECLRELNLANNFRLKCITFDERFRVLCEDKSKNTINIAEVCDDSVLTDDIITDFHQNDYETINQDEDNCFKCALCKKVLKTKTSLLKHYVSMHEKRKHLGTVSGSGSERRYHCTTCTYSTPHSQTLVNHMRRHNGERPYICECGKSFTQSSSLAAHRKTHSSVTYFTCSLCGKQFKHAFALKNHSQVHETGSFSCNICNKTLKSKQSLQAHMHRHLNICNYNCEACGDIFVTSAELLNHKKTHSSERKVECHLCGYKTHTKKNLIIHIKRHTGNRAHKCIICQIAFYTQSNLRRHQRVHTKDKPFSCPVCSQKFTYSPSLNKHMKTVHGIDSKWADLKWKDSKIVKLSIKTEKFIKAT